MLGLGLGLTPGNPLFGSRGVTAAQVIAGVGPRVTPGYNPALTPGVTATGRTAVLGSGVGTTGWTQATGTNTSITFNQESDVTDFITATGFGVAGAGTEADPHIIRNLNLTTFDATRNDTFHVFYWNDTSGLPYWIKFENISFGVGAGVNNRCGDLYINAPTGGGAIIQNCEFANFNSIEGVNLAPIVAVRGTTRLVEVAVHRLSNSTKLIYKNGAAAIIEIIDSLFDNSVGSWSGGSGFIYNNNSGGSLLIRRSEFDFKASVALYHGYDMTFVLDRIDWNSSENANCQAFIPTSTGYAKDPFILGLTMTDCRAYAGSSAVSLIGWNTVNSNQTVANWTFTNCHFIATGVNMENAVMVALGKGDAGATGTCDNVTFSWCRLSRSETDGVIPSNEIFYLSKASDTIIEYCWIDSCGEDAYEFAQPYDGCGVRFCGGGEVTGSTVGGNMVDIYGGGANWASSTNCFVHHIWGECGGSAIHVDSCTNVTVSDIDIVNVSGDFATGVPTSCVRLHSRAASGLNGVVVIAPLTSVVDSYNGWPCKLTYQSAAETTVSGTEVATETDITLASSAGFLAGDLINIALVDGTIHYTSQVGAPVGAVITIADALPLDSALNGEVQRVTPFDAGTVTWWDGISATLTGTDGIVDKM